MVTRMAFWRMLVTIPFLILVLTQPVAGQDDRRTSGPEEATHFDYSNSHAFPQLFSPYITPFVPTPRLDNCHGFRI